MAVLEEQVAALEAALLELAFGGGLVSGIASLLETATLGRAFSCESATLP